MKKTLMAALVAATSLSSPVIADVGDVFVGERGGTREVQSITYDGDVAYVTVQTTTRKGKVKTRTFTVERGANGQYQTDSLGTNDFHEFLIDQVRPPLSAFDIDTSNVIVAPDSFHFTNVNVSHGSQLQQQMIDVLGHLYWILTDGPQPSEIERAVNMLTDAGYTNAPEVVEHIAWWSTVQGAPELRLASVLDDIDLTIGETDATSSTTYYTAYREYYNGLATEIYNDVVYELNNGGNFGITYAKARSLGYDQALIKTIDSWRDGIVSFGEMMKFVQILESLPQNDDDLYEFLNVNGLRDVHEQGWTGYGKLIGVYDYGPHGFKVSYVASSVAPGASILYTGDGFSTRVYGSDVTNHSYGAPVDGAVAIAAHFRQVNRDNPDALHVLSGPNIGTWCWGDEDVTTCDAEAKAFNDGALQGEYIFVGAYDPSIGGYNSYASGTEINGHWIVANGDGPNNGIGSSYAAPRVAGAAALIRHKFPNVSAGDTKDILIHTADDTFSGYNSATHGQGMLDVGAALSPVGDVQ